MKSDILVYFQNTFPKLSHSKACKLLNCSRTSKYYKKKMPAKDAKLKQIIKEVIGTSRKGREKVIRLVQKKYPEIGSYRIRRVYERYGFSLVKKLKRRIKNNPENPIEIPLKANKQWAMDFMSDTLVNGQRIRTLNIIDHFNRKCLAIKVSYSFTHNILLEQLNRVVEKYGKPESIRTDNGPEFISKYFKNWMFNNGIRWEAIQKGKPQQNAIIERFNKTYREDVLDAELFYSIEHAQYLTNLWLDDYNNYRPHQALNYQTPCKYAC